MFDGDDTLDGDDAAHMAVRIDWGNGVSTNGTVQIGDHGWYDIVGTARYTTPGDYALTIDVVSPNGTQITATGKADVSAPRPAPPALESTTPDVPIPAPTPTSDQSDQPQGAPGADAAAGQAASRSPGDASGGVPWLRLPGLRPGGCPADRRPPGEPSEFRDCPGQ